MSIKKILSFTAVLAVNAALLLSLTSCDKCKDGHIDEDKDFICDNCGDDMPCDHTDEDGNALCDKCGEFYEAQKVSSDFKITVYNDEGGRLAGVNVTIYDADGHEVLRALTNSDGEINGTFEVGSYFVDLELKDNGNIYIPGGYFNINDGSSNSFSYHAVDNTPDGTAAKPFFISEDEATYDIPAGATFNFTLKGESRKMIIENTNISVAYGGNVYTPAESRIELVISGPEDPSDPPTAFTITNTSDAENTVVLRFVWDVGTRNNPISVESEESYTTEAITYEKTVYYIFKASKNCSVTITSSTVGNHINMMNLTTSRVSNDTSGAVGSSVTLDGVNAGDTILIQVSTSSEIASEISFDFAAN